MRAASTMLGCTSCGELAERDALGKLTEEVWVGYLVIPAQRADDAEDACGEGVHALGDEVAELFGGE